MNTVKLFIVDDHYMIIEGITSLMHNEPEIDIIGHAQNAQSCMAFLQRMQPDVIFLVINLPDKSGIDVFLLFHKDSNLNQQIQRLLCYHYTMEQCFRIQN